MRRDWVSSIEYITAAIDRYRAGEIDAYTVDETIHHYHRAARELWKFCWSGGGGTWWALDQGRKGNCQIHGC